MLQYYFFVYLIIGHSLQATTNQNYFITGSSIEVIGEITLHESEYCKICSIEFFKNGFYPFPVLANKGRKKKDLTFSITKYSKKIYNDRIFFKSTNQRFNFTISHLTKSDSMVINTVLKYSCFDCLTNHFDAVASIPVIVEREKKGK